MSGVSDGDRLFRRPLRTTRGPADARTARNLGIATDAVIIEIEVLGELDGQLISFEAHRFRADHVLTLPFAFLVGFSIVDALQATGISRRLATTRLLARLPNESEARHLELSVLTPILQMERVHVDIGGTPVHYSVSVFPADRIEIVSPAPDVTSAGSLPESGASAAGASGKGSPVRPGRANSGTSREGVRKKCRSS